MKKLHITICLIFMLSLSGCNNLNKKNNNFDLSITEDISMVNGKLRVEFITNLPDETIGYIRVLNDDLDFYKQSYSKVNHGRIRSPELFSFNESSLPKGNYKIIFALPSSSDQPERIMGILGSDYENIKSSYLKDDSSEKKLEYIVDWTID